MTHFAHWQITDISVVNEYFVCIDFHTALGFPTINSIIFVFHNSSRCSAVITMTLLFLLLLVSWGHRGIDGTWDGFSETQVVLYCLKAGEPVVQSRVLIPSSLILFSCFSHSYLSLRNKQLTGGESLNTWVTCYYGQCPFSLFSLSFLIFNSCERVFMKTQICKWVTHSLRCRHQ